PEEDKARVLSSLRSFRAKSPRRPDEGRSGCNRSLNLEVTLAIFIPRWHPHRTEVIGIVKSQYLSPFVTEPQLLTLWVTFHGFRSSAAVRGRFATAYRKLL
ncbi:MAG: hypothetical protein ACLP00_22350, partial [Terracidiphilus sp.]